MTQVTELSDLLEAAAERASQVLVHVAGACRGGATGSLYDASGVIVTTARAVAGREQMEVVQGDQSAPASVVGYDAATDIGVLRMGGSLALAKAPTWSTRPLRLGSLVLSASRPGRAPRVRLGVVSQVGDAWHSLRGGRLERYVEMDLSPEPGFSGGLGFDLAGNAVGMSSAGLMRGAALLVEKTTLERVVGAILTGGRVRRGYLGIGTQAARLPEALAAANGQAHALLVSSVQPDSAAERAQLGIGDLLLSLGGERLTSAGSLQAALEDAEGRPTTLELLRAGQRLSVEVTPGARS